jgi:hypothetical protein
LTDAGAQVYDFWAERGEFKWFNSRRVPGPRNLLEIRKGSVQLLTVPPKVAGLYRVVYGAFVVMGALLASLTYWAISASEVDVVLRASALSAAVVLTSVAFAIWTRWFAALLARRSPKPGLVLRVTTADYRGFYHRLVVTSGGEEFKLTVGGRRARVRRALSLGGS